MMHFLAITAWAFIGVAFTSARRIEELAREEGAESERIIGGADATVGQFPYAAAMHWFNNNNEERFTCTASILSPTTILTAAHCVVRDDTLLPAERFFLIANLSRSAQSIRINVESVIPHPQYGSPGIIDNDIAIMKTTEPINYDGVEIGHVCIAGPDTEQMQYRNATAIGWGNTQRFRFLPPNIPETLQFVKQDIVHNSVCPLMGGIQINDEKICAMGPLNGICNGDSGGPLVHLSNDQDPVQIGIASYGNAIFGCGSVSPAVWTRVSSHYDFIMETSGDNSICVI